MPPEIAEQMKWAVLMVLIPGLCLLALARLGGGGSSAKQTKSKLLGIKRLGWTCVWSFCGFSVLVALLLCGANGPGGPGSVGNPRGAVLVLGFVFVVGPMAALVCVGVVLTFLIQRAYGAGVDGE
jgi:hypothetical protein